MNLIAVWNLLLHKSLCLHYVDSNTPGPTSVSDSLTLYRIHLMKLSQIKVEHQSSLETSLSCQTWHERIKFIHAVDQYQCYLDTVNLGGSEVKKWRGLSPVSSFNFIPALYDITKIENLKTCCVACCQAEADSWNRSVIPNQGYLIPHRVQTPKSITNHFMR